MTLIFIVHNKLKPQHILLIDSSSQLNKKLLTESPFTRRVGKKQARHQNKTLLNSDLVSLSIGLEERDDAIYYLHNTIRSIYLLPNSKRPRLQFQLKLFLLSKKLINQVSWHSPSLF